MMSGRHRDLGDPNLTKRVGEARRLMAVAFIAWVLFAICNLHHRAVSKRERGPYPPASALGKVHYARLALAARKAQGVKLGNPTNLAEAGALAGKVLPIVRAIQTDGASTRRAFAGALHERRPKARHAKRAPRRPRPSGVPPCPSLPKLRQSGS